jgi:hypothetical protein
VGTRFPRRDGLPRRQPQFERHHTVGLGSPGQDHDLTLERIRHVDPLLPVVAPDGKERRVAR